MSAMQLSLFGEEKQPGEYAIPAGEPVRRCASCGASIVWAKTEGGKPIPLDLRSARQLGDQRVAVTHFASCPHGRQWRREP